MMATSLASQLSSIQSLNAARLASSSSLSSHASYLFPRHISETHDLDIVFALGETGWNELCTVDARLSRWDQADALFGSGARTQDRTMLTAEENARLDEIIESFLQLVGPVLLTKSSAKCLEWLVRRFRIHEFNVLAVLRAFLPFHTTPQFARMLHILELESFPFLRFLQPCQKAAESLPISVLLSEMLAPTQGSTSLDLIRFISGTLDLSRGHAHRAQILFWSSTLTQFSTRCGERTKGTYEPAMSLSKSARKQRRQSQMSQDSQQVILSIVIPAATHAARSRDASLETQMAACLVLCAIGASFHLSANAIASTITDLLRPIKGAQSGIMAGSEHIRALLIACSSLCSAAAEDHPENLVSASAAMNLTRIPGCALILASLSQEHNIQSFLHAFFRRLVNLASHQAARELLADIVEQPSVEGGLLNALDDGLIQTIIRSQNAGLLTPVLQSLRVRRPKAWTEAMLVSGRSDDQNEEQQADASSDAVPSSLRGPSSADARLWLQAQSDNPSARAQALERIMGLIKSGEIGEREGMTQELFLARLASDGDVTVLSTIYSEQGRTLLNVCEDLDAVLSAVEAAIASVTSNISADLLGVHLAFVLGTLLERRPELSARILKQILWPNLLMTRLNTDAAVRQRRVLTSLTPFREGAIATLAAVIQRFDDVDDIHWNINVVGQNQAVVDAVAKIVADGIEEDGHPAHNSLLQSCLAEATGERHSADKPSQLLSILVVRSLLVQMDTTRACALAHRSLQQMARSRQDYSLRGQRISNLQPMQVLDKVLTMPEDTLTVAAHSLLQAIINVAGQEVRIVPPLAGKCETPSVAKAVYQFIAERIPSEDHEVLLAKQLFASLGDAIPALLASIWTDTAQTEKLSSTASAQMRAYLAAFSSNQSVDFQCLMPHLLIALTASTRSMRTNAIESLRLVGKLAKESQGSPDVNIWGMDTLYGKSSERLKFLDSSVVQQFTSALYEHQETLCSGSLSLPNLLGGYLSSGKDGGKNETAFRKSIISFLVSHMEATPSLQCKLHLLQQLEAVQHSSKLVLYAGLLEQVIEAASGPETATKDWEKGGRAELHRLLFESFSARSKNALQAPTSPEWKLLERGLVSNDCSVQRSSALAVRRVFGILTLEQRLQSIRLMVACLSRQVTEASEEIRQSLNIVEIDSLMMTTVVEPLRRDIMSKASRGSGTFKRARSSEALAGIRDTDPLAALTEILSSALTRNLAFSSQFIVELFELLHALNDLQIARKSETEYLLHLCMSNLNKVLEGKTSTGDLVQALRIDTVIAVIQDSVSPATFHQALLLLSTIASLAPDLALHSAMPIFTFVGSTVLHRDDSFSFNVVERVLTSIVPSLVKSLQRHCEGEAEPSFALLKASRTFLRIFTDSATHIPRHRRQAFFLLLTQVAELKEYPAAVSMLLVDREAHKIVRQSQASIASTLQLPFAIFSRDSLEIQLSGLISICNEIQRLYTARSNDKDETGEFVFLERSSQASTEHSERQVEPVQQIISLLLFVKMLVKSPSFQSKLSRTEKDENAQFGTLVRLCLEVCQFDEATIGAIARECLDAIMLEAPLAVFFSLAQDLVSTSGPIGNAALRLTAARLRWIQNSAERQRAARWSPTIIAAAVSHLTDSAARRSSLEAIHALCQDLTTSEHQAATAAIPRLIALLGNDAVEEVEERRALSIVASLSSRLGPRIIPHLKSIVPICLSIVTSRETSPELLKEAVDTLSELLSSVGRFMEGYTEAILRIMTTSGVRSLFEQSSPVAYAFQRLLAILVKTMAADKLLTSVFALWLTDSAQAAENADSGILRLIEKVVGRLSRIAVAENYKSIFRFLLHVLDSRCERACSGTLTPTEAAVINGLEDSAIAIFVRLVLKLNETNFRPLFLRIFDWAALDLVEENSSIADPSLVSRRIVLYKVSNALSDQLRGLISHYYGTLMDLTVELLEGYSSGALADEQLWSLVIASVEKSARYDEGTFWNPSRLQKIAPAFVGQVCMRNDELSAQLVKKRASNTRSPDIYTSLISPAVARLAHTVSDEASLRVFNNCLLTQLRIDADATKVAALNTLTAFWSDPTLSSVLLGLVPETVPHVAELMDGGDLDEGSELREASKALIAAVEGVLGEPLDTYLI